MLTMMEVEVEELKTRTVTKIPIINPTAGFCINSLCWKILPVKTKAYYSTFDLVLIYKRKHLPAVIPELRRNALASKSSEHMKKYNKAIAPSILSPMPKRWKTFSLMVMSVKAHHLNCNI